MVRRAGGPTVGTKRAAAWVPLNGAQVKSKGKATAPAAGASSREMWAKAPSSVREARTPAPSQGEHLDPYLFGKASSLPSRPVQTRPDPYHCIQVATYRGIGLDGSGQVWTGVVGTGRDVSGRVGMVT